MAFDALDDYADVVFLQLLLRALVERNHLARHHIQTYLSERDAGTRNEQGREGIRICIWEDRNL